MDVIRLGITGRNFAIEDKLREYVQEKLGGLDKYLPRRDRASVYGEVVLLDDPSGREDNRYVCEVVLRVRGDKMVSREGTVNMYAAIDIVEAKLKAQLGKYKAKRTAGPRRLRMLTRWMGHKSPTDTSTPEGGQSVDNV